MVTSREQNIQDIVDGIGQFKRVMQIHFAGGFADLKLSPTQLHLLRSIQLHQPISHKDLAHFVQLTPSAVSQLLDGLDRSNCIVRTPSPSDRRISYISVSRSGKRKLDDMFARHKKLFSSAFEALDDHELQVYLQAQQKLIAWLETNQPPHK